MNKTLQDRLVKELRLHGVSNTEDGNTFLPTFLEVFNRRFERAPNNPHDPHRPLQDDEDLATIFSWQEERNLSRSLTVHFKPPPTSWSQGQTRRASAAKAVRVNEWDDGRVEIRAQGRSLPFSIFDQHPHIARGAVVENKRLGAILSVIQTAQVECDRTRLTSKKLTLRQKDRIRAAGEGSRQPPPPAKTARKRRTRRGRKRIALARPVVLPLREAKRCAQADPETHPLFQRREVFALQTEIMGRSIVEMARR